MSISNAFGTLLIAFVGIKIICWVYKLVRKLLDVSRSVQNVDFADKKTLTTVNIPDDAHDAVEVFAKLVNKTCAILDQAYTRDKYFNQVCIDLKFGEDDASSLAEFSFNFDWNMEGFLEAYGYSLGKGFSVDGEDVCYKSDRVQGLYSWLGAEAMERKRTGGVFNAHFAMALTDGIVATFVNNCPSAYVNYKSPKENGFFVIFKFK